MGEPEPTDPQSTPAPEGGRADWLVGAEEGIEAELKRGESPSRSLPKPTLFRPGQDGAAEPPEPVARAEGAAPAGPAPVPLQAPQLSRPKDDSPPEAPRRTVGRVKEDGGGSEFQQGPGTLIWQPAPSSVPEVRRNAPGFRPMEPSRDFPMDDTEERARARASAASAAAEAAEQTVRVHTIVTPDAFDIASPPVPWWMQALHALQTERKAQLLAGLFALLLLVVGFWPRGPRAPSIGDVRQHADRYDGRTVRLSGRIGEAFEVGSGWAFYLSDGRDTIVVFTRSRTPQRDQHVSITGTISTGYLDGLPRSALFEDGH